MALSWIRRMLKNPSRPVARSGRKQPHQGRFAPSLEPLGDRILPAVTAIFIPPAGVLTVLGDAADNTVADLVQALDATAYVGESVALTAQTVARVAPGV